MTGRRKKKFESIKTVLLYVALIFMAFIMLIPFAWMISASLKLEKDVFSFPIVWIPEDPQWSNYKEIWQKVPLLTGFFNSIKLTVVVTVLQFITSALAAYAFAKVNFPLKNLFFMIVLSQLMFPAQVFILPQYEMISALGKTDSLFALVFPALVSAFGTFFLRQTYMGIPDDLLEAARIDGCGHFRSFISIAFPFTKTAMAALAVFTALFAYGDLMWPLIVNTKLDKLTLSSGLSTLRGQFSVNYPNLMAGSVLAMIPMIIIYIIFQRQFIEGIALTGTKA